MDKSNLILNKDILTIKYPTQDDSLPDIKIDIEVLSKSGFVLYKNAIAIKHPMALNLLPDIKTEILVSEFFSSISSHLSQTTYSIKAMVFEETIAFETSIFEMPFIIENISDLISNLFFPLHPPLNQIYDFPQFMGTDIKTYSLPIQFPSVRIFGRNFSDKYWKEIPTEHTPKKSPSSKKHNSRKKALNHTASSAKPLPEYTPTQPSLWDFLFYMLSPSPVTPEGIGINLPHELYGYQKVGIDFLISNHGALLADDMGTGKTVMSTIAMRSLLYRGLVRRILIVVPLSVIKQWHDHIADWASDIIEQTVIVQGTNRELLWQTPMIVYITTYDTLANDVIGRRLKSKTGKLKKSESKVVTGNFDLVILDEAHRISNVNSNRFKSVTTAAQTAKFRWALTGTPVQNNTNDLLALMNFILPGQNIITADMPQTQIANNIAPYILRRRKMDVIKDLPPKIHQEIWLTMSENQVRQYRQAYLGIQQKMQSLGSNASSFEIKVLFHRSTMLLKQLCNFAQGAANSPKTEELKDQLLEITAIGEKAIVFTQFIDEGLRKIERSLKSEGLGCAVIWGGQSQKERESEIKRFKDNPQITVLIASVKTAGEGLNLTEASYVIHFDHWWNPATMRQAEDRAHRKGQTKTVNVYSYWVKDSIDEQIRQILKTKTDLFDKLVDNLSEKSIEDALSDDDMREIFGILPPSIKPPVQQPTLANPTSVQDIYTQFMLLSPTAFEHLVKDWLRFKGYKNARVIGGSNDGGIDIEAFQNNNKVVVQCKRYKDRIGPSIAREFAAAIHDKRASKGILVVTSDFTRETQRYCQDHGIEMFNGIQLSADLHRHGIDITKYLKI